MKSTSLAFVFLIFTTSTKVMARGIDTLPAKRLAEKGAQGDIIIGKQNQKDQLRAQPQVLQQKDSVISGQPKKKKSTNKSRKCSK